VSNLWRISCPGSKVYVPPFPLEWIFAPFDRDYYAYNGSFSQPPCSEIVTWIVQQEPIAISPSQVRPLTSSDRYLLLSRFTYESMMSERNVSLSFVGGAIPKDLFDGWPVASELSTGSATERS